MRIHLRSTTCWETSAPRFRDGLVGKGVRDHKGIKAIVEISVIGRKQLSYNLTRAVASPWEH